LTSKILVTNKTKATTIALVLALTIPAILAALPIVGAHDPPWEISTWIFVSATNPVIGVGQQVNVIYWSNEIPPTAIGAYGDRWTYTIEVTKPDGTTETLGPFESDPVGGGWTTYTPNQVGEYTIVAHMEEHTITGLPTPPGQTIDTIRAAEYVGDTYVASASDPFILTVQEDPIEAWKETPLPTEYWERPINAVNRKWYVLAGNWLSGPAQNLVPTYDFAYGPGPESPHIMWATPMWTGGIMDERFGVTGYQTAHYEGLSLSPPIILDGKIYYNVQSLPKEGWRVLDLYTGEELWFHNTTGPVTGVSGSRSGSISGESLAFGQIYDYSSPNQHGGFPYLWSTSGGTPVTTMTPFGPMAAYPNWAMFDAYTGNYMLGISNVPSWVSIGGFGGPSPGLVYGKDGSIVFYNIVGSPNPAGPFFPDVAPFYLQCWNTSRAIWYKEEWSSNEYWMWRPGLNETYDGNNGFSLNVSIPAVQGDILAVREGEFIIGGTEGANYPGKPVEQGNLWALSLEKGQEGTLLWNRTFTPPRASAVPGETVNSYRGMQYETISPEDGVFIYMEQLTRKYWGYSIETGEQLWESDPENQMQFYGLSTARNTNAYQGKFFSYGYGGTVTAYNITTGEVLWVYTAEQEGFESPYGNYPVGIACIADGKLYLTTSEHSPTQPLWRGSRLRCINATDGEEIWKILHWSTAMAAGSGVFIADGYAVSLNSYDNRIYCYGKGPSATTVTGPDTSVPLGEEVLIQGTVTDVSAGTKQGEQAARFPNGVPAVADESMSEWMEYLYMQQPCPENAEGVEVVITTLDPNGNTYELGRTTTDIDGTFSCVVDPPVPGKYKIIATFAGSKSYYGSSAIAYINVEEAPSPAQPIEPEPTEPEPTEPEPTEPAEAPLITTETAIIAAVAVAAVIGIAAYWQLRKRK
jgi:hypothetical protein